MVKAFLLLLFVFSASAFMVSPVVVSAHQSGCHRWHSCPSDTGSYVCGDLGYYSECGSSTTYTDPDYQGQGTDNGQQKADEDTTSIQASAETDAQDAGKNDGNSSGADDPRPDASATCDKTFSYASPQPDEYVDAFHDSYLDACTETYNTAYNAAYEAAYQSAADELQSSKDQADTEASAAVNASDKSGYWVLGGLGLLSLPAVIGKLRKK